MKPEDIKRLYLASFQKWWDGCFSKPEESHINQSIMSDQTIGEKRVRTSFNPSQDDTVSQIKQKTAELINLVEGLKEKDGRLAATAQTAYEEAAMWAVKAATA